MGKLLFTNNSKWNNELRNTFSKIGLTENLSFQGLTCYKKRHVNNENYFQKGNDCLVITGSWAYLCNNTQDSDMEIIYQDLITPEKSIDYVRKNLIGTYAFAYIHDNKIQIYVDECHTYALYYYIGNEGVVVSNMYYHVEKVSKQQLDSKIFATVAGSIGLASNRTPFKNIYRLMESQFIEYDYNTNIAVIKECTTHTKDYTFRNFEEVIGTLKTEIELQSRCFCKKTKRKLLFATGGLDSRLRLSLDLLNKQNTVLSYWEGNDSITNGTLQDLKINQMLCNKFSLKSVFYDVSIDFKDCIGSIDFDELDRYGEYLSIYAHNKKWLSLFDNIDNIDEIEFGTDADILRELSPLDDTYYPSYSIKDFVKNVCLRSNIFQMVFEHSRIESLIEEDLSYLTHNIPLDKRMYANIFNYLRHDMAMIIPNYINEFYYCFPFFHSKRIWDIIYSIPYEYRENSKISLRLIKEWCPELLQFPVFTHHHFATYDKNDNSLKQTRIHSCILKIKPYILNTKIYDWLYVKCIEPYFRPQNKKNKYLFKTCIDTLKGSESFTETGIKFRASMVAKNFDIATLCTVVAKCKFIDQAISHK